ncbi:hypothetical protein BOTNAR_0868g00020 [Botryotinia narcissicola]|uniref:Uncharacterized protein n=1 Tax=Botryotinia narcissicola TaxID=278944 RepID=A0A4Z1H840_9HELO|nr:hypothetical protein BOTNAR_0868g00020 [Botryotinia narcissicola]
MSDVFNSKLEISVVQSVVTSKGNNTGSCGAIIDFATSGSRSMSMGENTVEGVFASGVEQDYSNIRKDK